MSQTFPYPRLCTLPRRVLPFLCIFIATVATSTCAAEVVAPQEPVMSGASADEVAEVVAGLIADVIPRRYERTKDWGRTKRITTGVRSSGNFFEFDIHRRKTEVKHGVWKRYRVAMVDPDKTLDVRIENLRSAGPGRIACTLLVAAKLDGWARAKVYNRGIHLIALEAVCETKVRLRLDVEVAIEAAPSAYLTGIAVRPVVTGARLKLDDFRLTRVSDVRGPIVRELGDGLRHLIEDELDGPKLVAKLNRSIEKRHDRLQLTPERLLGLSD